MVERRKWSDARKLVVLALAVAVTVQVVIYWAHVESVRKTVSLQLMVYQQGGADSYRSAVLNELEDMGMEIEPGALATVEDRDRDEFRVELRYEWPLRVLFFTFNRPHLVRARTIILDS